MLPAALSLSDGIVICYVLTNDVKFAHEPRLLDVAAQLKHSAHAALGMAINCVQASGCTGLLFGRLK